VRTTTAAPLAAILRRALWRCAAVGRTPASLRSLV